MTPVGDAATVAVVVLPGAYALDVSIPSYVLGGHPGYRVLLCGDDAGAGGGVVPTRPLAAVRDADVVVVPGYDEDEHEPSGEHLDVLRAAHARGARLVAVCTGVFALAAAGLLHGRTVTTHWASAPTLRARHPELTVVERLLVDDGDVVTSAGASAGFDVCLHVIRTDLGASAADGVARHAVASTRGAAEPQYSTLPEASRADLAATREWVLAHLDAPITVQHLAERSHLSRRTFIRRFERETGSPPMRWVLGQRVLQACRLLETSDRTVEWIAAATGFGTAAHLRTVFRRETGLTPGAYRRAHAADARGRVAPQPPAHASRAPAPSRYVRRRTDSA